MIINIQIRRKKASSPAARIVCGNTDYQIAFAFDSEWDAYETKTARFIWNDQYADVVFSGNVCDVPKITDTTLCMVGVFAGDLHTTTPAYIKCDRSILCGDGSPAEPSEDVYAQIMEKLNNGGSGGVSSWNDLEDKPFGEIETYILPETELTFEMNDDLGVPMAFISLDSEMEVGNTYTVTFDGVAYTCLFIDDGAGGGMMGNMMLFGGDDTGEPFFVVLSEGACFLIPVNGAASAVVSIRGVANVPIASEYAPEPPMLDLFAMGAPAITESGWPVSFEFGREDIVKLAAKKGLIKIRAQISVNEMYHLTDSSNDGYMSLAEGVVEFTAPVLYTSTISCYYVTAFLNDCMLLLRFMPGGWATAKAIKLAIYDANGAIFPQDKG